MNKREAKLRALKLILYSLKEAFANNGVFDLVDEDTSNEEALQIADEAKAFRDRLRKRIINFEERLSKRKPDTLRVYDMGEVAGVKLTCVKGNVFATPAKRGDRCVRVEISAAQPCVQADLLPCGHTKSASWDDNRGVCVACEVTASRFS